MPIDLIKSALNFLLSDPLFIFILAVTFGVLGLIFSLIFWGKLSADFQSRGWPQVSGRIDSSRVEERAFASRSGGHRGNSSPRFVPLIRYSYTVGGAEFRGERIGNGIYVALTRGGANGWLKRYPANATVNVYYNPADPADAMLETAILGNLAGLLVGLVAGLAGLFLIGFWLKLLLFGR